MERLRHVAQERRRRPGDRSSPRRSRPLTGLRPAPSELVPLCRNLVERNPTCGPLWWLCAHLLAKPESMPDCVAPRRRDRGRPDTRRGSPSALPDDAAVMTVGYPAIAARALRRCRQRLGARGARRRRRPPDGAGDGSGRRRRRARRCPKRCSAAMRSADLVAASRPRPARRTRSSPRWAAASPRRRAAAIDVPVWLVAGRRPAVCRCRSSRPSAGRLDAELRDVRHALRQRSSPAPMAVAPRRPDALVGPECPPSPNCSRA